MAEENWTFDNFNFWPDKSSILDDILSAFTITTFSYFTHTTIFMVQAEFRHPDKKRVKKIYFYSVLWEFILYFFVATFGYLS